MNKLLIYAIILVLITLVIIYRTKENLKVELFKGCTGVANANECTKNFLSYSFVVPIEMGHEAKAVSVPAKHFATAAVFPFGVAASAAPAAKFGPAATASAHKIGTNSVTMNVCCDTIENMNNAKSEIKLTELDNKVSLLQNLLPPYVRSKIKTNIYTGGRGPKSYNLNSRLEKLENAKVMKDMTTAIKQQKSLPPGIECKMGYVEMNGKCYPRAMPQQVAVKKMAAPQQMAALAKPRKSNSFFSFLGF